ncbi:hypothetical protein [Rubinisphaera brasiliensis]|uniref:Uncharacterized protein n=1 Tax=Rubinisphaera brasiliensis (strain ATCC 49424 / DSM 5305 / JCM 21570 / IAM 15109 / NBRC 103401 / IFAM 1448) TaxID=756272 RepID=F0SJ60_RUBBR|nr:hypothetical protein [Rubinisphaera brasiliensis]ADY58602.1 hypothetical protein Plabr_0981 [Rubinisphaera brasiliensis DSM 5305]
MPPQIDRVADDDFSRQIGDLAEQYEEVGVMRPDERLSEAFPEQFALYCEHFIDFFPRSPYHYKKTYDKSSKYGGWPQSKTRNGSPRSLIDNGSWQNRRNEVERHLDHEHWQLYNDFHGIGYRRTEFFWIAQHMPSSVSFHAIDADNKTRIGWYGEGTPERPLMPVMEMPFEHFVKLKKIYDAFPDRIWCITSETLGLDIIKRHRLQPTEAVHERTKRGLTRIGLGGTEVHPMPGRCKRRPFGEHYWTITADGVLTTWQNQLDYYLNPGPAPSFRHIASVLLKALEDQRQSWLIGQYNRQNQGIDVPAEVARLRELARRVEDWLDDDCPPMETTTFTIRENGPGEAQPVSRLRNTSSGTATTRPFDLSSLRGGKWAKALEEITRNGLPAEDSVGQVVCEMAKWLWWVELHDVPEEERHGRVLGLLNQFVADKHNGFISRWNEGQHREVLSQVSRCLDSAIALKVPDRASCFKTFETLRHKRTTGTYKRVIFLEPIILGEDQCPSDTTSTSLLSTLFSVPLFEEKVLTPLPDKLIKQIRTKSGRRNLDGYLTKFVNLLYYARQDNQFLYLRRQELRERGIIPASPNKFTTQIKILIATDVIDKESYRAKARPTGYRLRSEARRLIDEEREEPDMP